MSDFNIPLNFLRTHKLLFDWKAKIYISVLSSLLILLTQDISNCSRVRHYGLRCSACVLTFNKWCIFKGCFVPYEKVCYSSLSLELLSDSFQFSSKRRVFRLSPLALDTRFRSGFSCHIHGRSGHTPNRLFFSSGGDISTLFA